MIRRILLLCLFCSLLPVSAALADDEILREILSKNSADYAPVDKDKDQVMTLGDDPLRHQSTPETVHADDGNPFKASGDLGIVGSILNPVGAGTGQSK